MRLTVPYFAQRHDYDCGPAVMQMVLTFFGFHTKQELLGQTVGTSSKTGTAQENMATAAREFGLGYIIQQGANVKDIDQYLNEGLPVIVNFIEPDGNVGHYGLVIGHEKDELIIHDPWNGPGFKMTEKEFIPRWKSEYGDRYHWILVIDKRVLTPLSKKIRD